MKTKIFIYLFAFTALILVFQLVNSSKVVKYQATTIAEKIAKIDKLKASLEQVETDYANSVHFSFDQNNEAQAFYPATEAKEIILNVEEKIYESNAAKGENPLILFNGIERKFLINKVKVLNHKWAIADFSDGSNWGEILIAYRFVDNEVTLQVIDQLLYYNN